MDFWTRRLYETGRVGKAWIVDNQSLRGLVARALGDPAPGLAWALPAVLVAVVGLGLAARARRESHGVLLTACTALLVCPISWTHHWVPAPDDGPRAAASPDAPGLLVPGPAPRLIPAYPV